MTAAARPWQDALLGAAVTAPRELPRGPVGARAAGEVRGRPGDRGCAGVAGWTITWSRRSACVAARGGGVLYPWYVPVGAVPAGPPGARPAGAAGDAYYFRAPGHRFRTPRGAADIAAKQIQQGEPSIR